MEKVRVAVIGVGHLGKHHARICAELPGVELVAVVDIKEETARGVAEELGVAYATDVREVMERIDAAHVVVPTDQHYVVTKQLLEGGKHVLLEKPMTATVEEADELLALARRADRVLQVGHVERFNPAILGIQKVLTQPIFIEVHRLAPFNPRGTEVGVVLDLMIHDLDIILHLVRSEVEEVVAVGVPVLTEREDIANARLTFANGCVANVTASRVSAERMRKIRFFQSDAYISLDYVAQNAKIYRRQGWQITDEVINFSGEQPLQREIQSFVESVREGTRPIVSGEDGRNALVVATRVTEAVRAHLRRLKALHPGVAVPGVKEV
ncbi:MAG: Gfo/Idh/MocA family oxidoreductase [bacterium]|nr:Gfo/Idh/MocA family oxidoreductase [bacterium]